MVKRNIFEVASLLQLEIQNIESTFESSGCSKVVTLKSPFLHTYTSHEELATFKDSKYKYCLVHLSFIDFLLFRSSTRNPRTSEVFVYDK